MGNDLGSIRRNKKISSSGKGLGSQFEKLSKTVKSVKRKKTRKVLILSLDAAGKTSFLYRIKKGILVDTIPTIGYNHEDVEWKDSIFEFWDIGGQDGIRVFWKNYFMNVQGIIFVIDSSDRERLEEAKNELKNVERLIFQNSCTTKVVILILANKQDVPGAMSTEELYEKLNLNEFIGVRHNIFPCCTKLNTGLTDALDWLHDELKKRFK